MGQARASGSKNSDDGNYGEQSLLPLRFGLLQGPKWPTNRHFLDNERNLSAAQ